ncbi:hypothetical protein [Flavobacterium sp.]|uniref:hypothetical protein n=1 Tax=Flavobacterium sp. TaxID=239 RepID=UPI002608A77D|nr:hypothetical protein [Flavobacterium sp.]
MIKIENPKYKSAFLTLSFYTILIFLIIIRYKIMPSGNGMMILETIAPVLLPLIVLVLLLKNIWQYYYKSKTTIFSIIIHASIILVFFLLFIKLR